MSSKGSNDSDIAPSLTSPGSKIPVPIIAPSSKKQTDTVKEGTESIVTTPQMDDTAFLDDAITSACNNDSNIFSDSYMDEVIARSIKKSVEKILDGSLADLDGTRYIDEVITRCSGYKPKQGAKGTRDLISSGGVTGPCISEEKRQEICDNVVQRYLRAANRDTHTNSSSCCKISPSTKPMKRLSSGFLQKQTISQKPSLIAVPTKKSNIVTTMVGQQNSEPTRNGSSEPISFTRDDWRKKVDARNKMDESKVAGLEEQLKIVNDKLAVIETEKESIERKLKSKEEANDVLESQLADILSSQEILKCDLFARNEEVRQRNSNVVRLDIELGDKERKLEDAANAAIEAEKKIFDFEVNVKSLEAKLSLLEEENSCLRKESMTRTAAMEIKCLEIEEVMRKLVVSNNNCDDLEEKCGNVTEKLEDIQRENEKLKEEVRKLTKEIENLNKKAYELEKEEGIVRSGNTIKDSFDVIRSKYEMSNKLSDEIVKSSCEHCLEQVSQIEELKEAAKKSLDVLQEKCEELRQCEKKEERLIEEIEKLKIEKCFLQEELKPVQAEVTTLEVELSRMKTINSVSEEKVEILQSQVADAKKDLENMTMAHEDVERQRNSYRMKLEKMDDEVETLKEEAKKLRIEVGNKTDEIMLSEPKLRQAVQDLENYREMLVVARSEHNATLRKLEAAENDVKIADLHNSEISEKSIKLAEVNYQAEQEKREANTKLEQLDRALSAANLGIDKLVQEVEKNEREYLCYKKEVERQLMEILDI